MTDERTIWLAALLHDIGKFWENTPPAEVPTDLRERFNLGQAPQTRKVDVHLPFPHTRLIAYRNGAPAYPLGWVLLEPAGAY